LSVLGNKYTHYDLHTNNILLHKPFVGQRYILMRYHNTQNNTTITFKTEHIAKIIDYGRNYFNNNITNTNNIIENYLCKSSFCQPNCGNDHGYNSLVKTKILNQDFHHITPYKPNISHDLLFLSVIKNALQGDREWDNITLDYTSQTNFGTNEKQTIHTDHVIRNVHDAKRELETLIQKPEFIESEYYKMVTPVGKNIIKLKGLQSKYDGWTQSAEMDIYDNGQPYKFTYYSDHT